MERGDEQFVKNFRLVKSYNGLLQCEALPVWPRRYHQGYQYNKTECQSYPYLYTHILYPLDNQIKPVKGYSSDGTYPEEYSFLLVEANSDPYLRTLKKRRLGILLLFKLHQEPLVFSQVDECVFTCQPSAF